MAILDVKEKIEWFKKTTTGYVKQMLSSDHVVMNNGKSLEEDNANLTSRVSSTESSISTINNSITDINGDITDINGDINTISGDITDINGDINTINGNISTINGDITTINSNLTLLIGTFPDDGTATIVDLPDGYDGDNSCITSVMNNNATYGYVNTPIGVSTVMVSIFGKSIRIETKESGYAGALYRIMVQKK